MRKLQGLPTVVVRGGVAQPRFSHHPRSRQPRLDRIQLLVRGGRFARRDKDNRDRKKPFSYHLIYIVVLCQDPYSEYCSFHFSCSAVSTPPADKANQHPYETRHFHRRFVPNSEACGSLPYRTLIGRQSPACRRDSSSRS